MISGECRETAARDYLRVPNEFESRGPVRDVAVLVRSYSLRSLLNYQEYFDPYIYEREEEISLIFDVENFVFCLRSIAGKTICQRLAI